MAVGYLLPAGWLADVDPRLVWRDECLDAAHSRRAVLFSVPGCCFHWLPAARWSRSPSSAGTAGALVGGLQNIGSGVLASLSAMLPQTGQGSLGLLMTLMGLLIVLCWLPLATRMSHQGQPV